MNQKLNALFSEINKLGHSDSLEDLQDFIQESFKIKKNASVEISPGLNYHIEHQISLAEPVYRENTKEYYELMIEAKDLFASGVISLDDESQRILNSDIGKFAMFEGMLVPLDSPMELEEESDILKLAAEFKGKKVNLNKPRALRKGEPGFGRKQYVVYVKNGDKVKRITFGDPNLKAKPEKAKNRKSFRARHKCDQKKDKTTPGYWACHYPPNW